MGLYFKETGQSNSETIIFLHEINMAGWMWDEQVKSFQDYHCIIPDLPEHGKSQDVLHFTMENAAEMIIDLIKDKTHNGQAHLVGIGLGGQIILEILNKAPEIVKTAFISGILVNNKNPTETFLKLLEYILQKYIPVKNDDLTIGSYIRSYGIPRRFIKKFKESTNIIQPDSAERIIRENLLFKIPLDIENTNFKVLIMAGEKEYNVIKQSNRVLDDELPNAKAYLVPGVGHIWNLESSQLFNKILRCWINGNILPDSLIKIN
ncbi:MAG: alpha/beta hydrolase [Methanobacterium sp.]|nr:alpha/beta hydrolase [Methanobacterium sp.]